MYEPIAGLDKAVQKKALMAISFTSEVCMKTLSNALQWLAYNQSFPVLHH